MEMPNGKRGESATKRNHEEQTLLFILKNGLNLRLNLRLRKGGKPPCFWGRGSGKPAGT